MLCRLFAFVSALLVYSTATAQIPNYLVFDKELSQSFGAENGITLHKFLYEKTDEFIPLRLNEENTFWKKSGGIGYRLLKASVLDLQVNWMFTVVQREAFGHGSRFREFGYSANYYNFYLIPPLGRGGSYAIEGTLAPNKMTTLPEISAMHFGGNEANLVLSDRLSSRAILEGDMHYQESILYLMTKNNLLFYLWNDRLLSDFVTLDGDVDSYILNLNRFYSNANGKEYSTDKLSLQSLVSLLNPMQIYSVVSLAKDYLLDGNARGKKIPSINFSKFNYLPSMGYNLTPFGSEFILTNYFFTDEQSLQVNLNYGDQTFFDFYSAGAKAFNLFPRQKLYVGAEMQIWSQPELQLEEWTLTQNEAQLGGLVRADVSYFPFKESKDFGLFAQVGYKTKGYVLGERLDEGLLLQFGISLKGK
jgi:hypothetical protein